MSAKRTIEYGEWLSDEVMKAAQSLVLHEFPDMSGLESPVLQRTLSFQIHRNEFVQIVHMEDSHWCVVTNVGCEEGVVCVYDSMYPSVTEATSRVIASLVFRSASKLTIRMMDVEAQRNAVDCGVLSIAYAFDICSGWDPCKVVYDHGSPSQMLGGDLDLTLTCTARKEQWQCEGRTRDRPVLCLQVA